VTSVSSFIRETFLATDPIDETYQGVKASTATLFMDIPMDGSSANATSYDLPETPPVNSKSALIWASTTGC
jgi:hypothetical protein